MGRAARRLWVAPLWGAGHETQVCAGAAAAHALVYDLLSSDIDPALAEMSRAANGGLDTYWRLPSVVTPRQAALAVFLAGMAGSAAVIVSGDSSATTLPTFVLRLLAEQVVAPDNPPTADANEPR